MSRELWEIVRADELKVGDIIKRHGAPFISEEITGTEPRGDYVYLDGKVYCAEIHKGTPVLRRVPDAEDPRVLRRALERMHKRFVRLFGEGDDGAGTLEEHINQARKELESEGTK